MMKASEIRNRIEKKEQTIEKKTNLLAKYEKKLAAAVDPWDRDDAEEGIERTHKAIEKANEQLAKYREQLVKAEAVEARNADMPEELHQMAKELETRWTEYDKKHSDEVRKACEGLRYNEIFQKFTGAEYELTHMTDWQIEEKNHKAAEAYVEDLWARISDKTGRVLDWNGIRCVGPALNGIVKGEKATVEVKTIGAGGWNIQRYHQRTLVNEL